MKTNESPPVVLIADDDADLLLLLKLRLQSVGMAVHIAETADTFYKILDEHPVDVVMLDIGLNTMSGAEICYQLKNDPDTSHLPVLLFSGHHRLKEVTEESGADGFLPKPVNIQQLQKTIYSLLDRPRQHEA